MMFMCTPFLPSWLMAHPALKFTDFCTNEFASLMGYQSRAFASPATAPDHTRASGPAGPDVAGLGVGWKH